MLPVFCCFSVILCGTSGTVPDVPLNLISEENQKIQYFSARNYGIIHKYNNKKLWELKAKQNRTHGRVRKKEVLWLKWS